MYNIKIKSKSEEIVVACTEKANISDILKKHVPEYSMPCGGNHSCGKCIVNARGSINPPTAAEGGEEELLLKKSGTTAEVQTENRRLACFLTACGDCEIELPNIEAEGENVITTNFFEKTESIQKDKDETSSGHNEYGIAVDIGTTTIIAYLFDNGNAKPLSISAQMNDQRRFGADVISRIDHCIKNGPDDLFNSVNIQLSKMFSRLFCEIGITGDMVSHLAITGNTAMLHMLMGYDTASIAAYPFTPKSKFNEYHRAAELFKELENASLYLPICIGGYIGADIVCAVEASGMTKKSELSMLVDIGTNGEMAIYKDNLLYACSTAAGPAFEGAGIKRGMTAKDGAITDIELKDGAFCVKTVNDKKPVGICGTGLINAVALLLELSVIEDSGYISDENEEYANILGEDDEGTYIKLSENGVILTQKDIRQLQLAKSAIHAGMLTLAHECKVEIEDIDTLYLCGGFGSYIDPQKAAKIGLIPKPLAGKAVMLGNAAGKGCSDMLFSKETIAHSVSTAESAIDIPLSTNAFFMEQYIEQMLFQ